MVSGTAWNPIIAPRICPLSACRNNEVVTAAKIKIFANFSAKLADAKTISSGFQKPSTILFRSLIVHIEQ